MFDIGAAELLVIAIVAILVIGPKDMPRALRTAGRWIGQVRRMSNHFRAGIDAMIREAELEDMEKKWQERNAQIMREHPGGETAAEPGTEMTALPPAPPESRSGTSAEPAPSDSEPDPGADDPAPRGAPPAASAEARARPAEDSMESAAEPQLPLGEERRVRGDSASDGKA